MSENSFQVGGRDFKLSKINAMKQYHLVRKLGPLMSELLPALKNIATLKKENQTQEEQLDQAMLFINPIMNGLSKLSDKDAEFVLYGLLAAVEIKQDLGNWARVVQGEMLMFDSLPLPVLLQAAGRSFMFNMTGFFDVHQQLS